MTSQDLYVVIHDVAPPHVPEIRTLLSLLEPFAVPVHAGLVPRWHLDDSSVPPRWDLASRRLLDDFDAVLVHGWTHRRVRGRWCSPVSWATAGSDELAGLERDELCHRLAPALEETRAVADREPVGLLPPAWQLPRRAEEVAFELGYPRVLRFGSIDEPQQRRGVTTWSWDWGWAGRPLAGLLDSWSGLRAQWSSDARCIALHPADVRRGLLGRVRRCLEERLAAGDVSRLLGAAA